MDEIEIYNRFRIRAFENQPGRWFAEARKVDGSKIEIALPGMGLTASITTPAACYTAKDAIELIKEIINSPNAR